MARDFSGGGSDYLVRAVFYSSVSDLTVATWFRVDAGPGGTVAFFYNGGGGTDGWGLAMNSGPVLAALRGGVEVQPVSPTGLSLGAWYHGALTRAGSGNWILYLNGAETARDVSGGANGPAGNLQIGQSLNCALAEGAMWSVGLLPEEIASLGKGFSPALVRPQSLLAYWPLGGRFNPEPDVRNGYNLTVTGAPTFADHPRIIKPRSAIYVP